MRLRPMTAADLPAVRALLPGDPPADGYAHAQVCVARGKIVGAARLAFPAEGAPALTFAAHTDDAARALLRWGITTAGGTLTTSVFDADAARAALLAAHGFTPQGALTLLMCRTLDDTLPLPCMPAGFRLARLRGEDGADWYVALPHTSARQHARERTLDAQRSVAHVRLLDQMDTTAEGTWAAFCVCRADADARYGWTDPVGTHPAYRRRGLARQVMLAALAALRAEGADGALLHVTDDNAPALALYESLGYTVAARQRWYYRGTP